MHADTPATGPLASAAKAARSIGLLAATVSVAALEAAISENETLRKRVQQLADELDARESSSDRAWGREAEHVHEIGQLKARIAELEATNAEGGR